MLEKDFEDILSRYPELIEDGLTLKGRQVTIHGRRMDMVFVDKFDRTLIVELKSGPIKDKDIGQIMSYEGMMLSSDDPTVRIMLIGTRVPPNIKRVLDHHGIAFLEIKHSTVLEHLRVKGDKDLLSVVAEEQPIAKFKERALTPHPALTKRAGLPDKISTVLCNQGSSFPEGYSEKLTIEEVRCLFGHLYINDINQKKKSSFRI